MTEADQRRRLNTLLENVISDLDVPDSKYEEAEQHYNAVGNWLNDSGSKLVAYSPRIYAQGSFALGTAVKPLFDDDYDVDAVCVLDRPPATITQQELKTLVGERLAEHETYAEMLDPKDGGRRCWTLKYADASRFHLDILPAIPDSPLTLVAAGISEVIARHAICITDRETWDRNFVWPKSNPQGYREWFKSRMQVAINKRRTLLANARGEIQSIPEYRIRTPLQRVIQLLKRHRDLKFQGDDDKPVSIIITTLAAQAYGNEEDLADALFNIVSGMRDAIRPRPDGIWRIPNPTNPAENFADKWNEVPRKRDLFFAWLDAVEREHRELLSAANGRRRSLQSVAQLLSESYGRDHTAVALQKYARGTDADGMEITLRGGHELTRFYVPHRQRPEWPVALDATARAAVSAKAFRNGFRPWTVNSADSLPKGVSLTFEADTNVKRPYTVRWQVVNTGAEARKSKCLRGDFYDGWSSDGLIRKESTEYTGEHWVQCFIVKNGAVVARSDEFVVNIE